MATAPNNPRDTPAMRQYAKFKAAHPDCLLLFRIGDFYELFDDDAVRISKLLGLTLTQRTAGIPMAGMPYHQLETYVRRLVAMGVRVAVADQVQDAAEAKGLVDRAVTRVLTPGTLVDESLLSDDRSHTLAAICFPYATPDGSSGAAPTACLALIDLSTGAFTVLSAPGNQVADELLRRSVTELIYPETANGAPPERLAGVLAALGIAGTPQPQWHFRMAEATEALCQQFAVRSLAGFDLVESDALIPAAGAIVRYLRATQAPDADPARAALAHLRPPRRAHTGETLLLDAASLRALEIDRTLRTGRSAMESGTAGSLLGVFSSSGGRSLCRTAPGRRLLREWLIAPPCRIEAVLARQACVATLVDDRRLAAELGEAIDPVQDVARICSRAALGRCTPRDLVALGRSLGQVGTLASALAEVPALAGYANTVKGLVAALAPVAQEIVRSCVADPPAHLREGGLIADGVDPALDEARVLQRDAGSWLAEYQAALISEHNLPSLKVAYNKIFGYYIELPKAQAQRAPAVFTRKQTLTNAERYTTPQLHEYEGKVTRAGERIVQRELELFGELCQRVLRVIEPASIFAQVVAELDVLLCFAQKATDRRWVRPEMIAEPGLRIIGGRHPVLDEVLVGSFVPNDVTLGHQQGGGSAADGPAERQRPTLALITGPNMAGKSTYIRQTALLVLLAHAGSFIPADQATIGMCDRIFTRIGADDALHAGQSTFMVEMTETASILNAATGASLVVLDEIGRGTSTLDGLSLAWAIAEDLATARADRPCPRTLFATHYHELTRLADQRPDRVANYQVLVREHGDQIVFLHRIVDGRADRSYGIHVARLAGVPSRVVQRADEILRSLSVEQDGASVGGGGANDSGNGPQTSRRPRQRGADRPSPDGQLSLFTQYISHPALDEVKTLNIEAMSPMQAFDALRKIRATLDLD